MFADVVVWLQLHVGGATWRSCVTAWFSGYVDACPGRTSCRTQSTSETPKSGGRSTPALSAHTISDIALSVNARGCLVQLIYCKIIFYSFIFTFQVEWGVLNWECVVKKIMLLGSPNWAIFSLHPLQESRKHLWIYDQVLLPSRQAR